MKHTIRSPLGLPCNRPPYGRLSAVDLATGDIVWQRPFGNLRDVTPLPIDLEIGLPNYGGPLLTGSGLVFIGATIGPYLRGAYHSETGEELWRARLPAGGQATPMTYRVENAPGGPRQFVVIAAGGHYLFHAAADRELGDTLVAFALPAGSE